MKKVVKTIYQAISIIIIITLLYAIFQATLQRNWTIIFTCILTLILVVSPYVFSKQRRIKLPTEIELIIVLFIYASLFLGEVHNFYQAFWWWDILLHTFSAIIFGFVGFTILYFMYNKQKIVGKPWAIAIFAFTFAIAIGAIWEIFEFSMDSFFGLNMQKSGLIDTMWDLIVDAIGALFSSTIAYIYLKTKKTIIFDGIIKTLKKENPKNFK